MLHHRTWQLASITADYFDEIYLVKIYVIKRAGQVYRKAIFYLNLKPRVQGVIVVKNIVSSDCTVVGELT